MKTTLKITILALLATGTGSCKSDHDDSEDTSYQKGVVRDYGNPALDGCGWMIEIQDTVFHPADNKLSNEFCKEGLNVYVKYRILSTTSRCAWTETDRATIEIIDIKTAD